MFVSVGLSAFYRNDSKSSEMLLTETETDGLILIVCWVNVWIQESFQRLFITARLGHFQHMCT